jgi:hypothetical protein
MVLVLIIALLALSDLTLAELVTIAPASARPHGADCESLHCAQLRVRELLTVPLAREGLDAAEDITVRVAPGSYELAEPLVFGERDHATDGRRVVWQGPAGGGGGARQSRGASARVLGGTRVSGWERAWGDVWKVKLGRRVWSLSENSRQSSPARHPNTNPGAGSGQLNGSASATSFSWNEGALPANVSVFGLGNTTVLMASGQNYYWTESWRVGSFNLNNRTANFVPPSRAGFPGDASGQTVNPGPHFYLQGSVGLLDEPGEFAMDSAGEWLYYWPRSGLPIEALEIVAPTSRRPVQIVGPSKDKPVRGLSFRGLEFVGSDQDPEGVWYLFAKARSNDTPKRFRNGVIFTENATDILIEHCRISAAGNAGIWLNLASTHVTIRGNWIEVSAITTLVFQHCIAFALTNSRTVVIAGHGFLWRVRARLLHRRPRLLLPRQRHPRCRHLVRQPPPYHRLECDPQRGATQRWGGGRLAPRERREPRHTQLHQQIPTQRSRRLWHSFR